MRKKYDELIPGIDKTLDIIDTSMHEDPEDWVLTDVSWIFNSKLGIAMDVTDVNAHTTFDEYCLADSSGNKKETITVYDSRQIKRLTRMVHQMYEITLERKINKDKEAIDDFNKHVDLIFGGK